MRSLARALAGLGLAGLVFGLALIPLTLSSDVPKGGTLELVLALVSGWGLIGAGLFAWWRRPENRTGALMVLTGFAFFASGLSGTDVPATFAIGSLFSALYVAIVFHLLLAFPSGRLQSRSDRCLVAFAYFVTTVLVAPIVLLTNPASEGCATCPQNPLLVADAPHAAQTLSDVLNGTGVAACLTVAATLAVRWNRARLPQRRSLAPVYGAGLVMLVLFAALLVAELADGGHELLRTLWDLALAGFGLVPALFLLGLARTRMAAAGSVRSLVARLTSLPEPGALRGALATALEDPTLELVYWLPSRERYVDARGARAELPEPGSGRTVTPVEHEGRRVGAFVHDDGLLDEPELVRAVGSAAALALENERLDAELRAKVEEVRHSRERLIEVGLAERRALERNLHDGAQQRLVSLALSLRMARNRLRPYPDEAEEILAAAAAELDQALAELRELARGIHPAVLSDRGLGAALETLARRAPLPVAVTGAPEERLPEPVELAAYFVATEALTNVVKYARASRATIDVQREDGRLLVAVADDGVGGADPARGSGLRGLADRMEALEGRLEVVSERGEGTVVRARIPCE
jgi:signal transduction histidine kinase